MNFHRISKMSLPFAIVGVLLVVPSLASAAQVRAFKETFGSAAQPTFGNPTGIAVDQASGDLYVIDQADQTVSRFKPDGTPANFSASERTSSTQKAPVQNPGPEQEDLQFSSKARSGCSPSW